MTVPTRVAVGLFPQKCPHCRMKIPKKATVCPFCTRTVSEAVSPSAAQAAPGIAAGPPTVLDTLIIEVIVTVIVGGFSALVLNAAVNVLLNAKSLEDVSVFIVAGVIGLLPVVWLIRRWVKALKQKTFNRG